jgi:hypothetical protein
MPEEKKLMEESARDEMIDILCTMSDRQVEPCVKPRLREIKGRPNAEVLDEFMGIIDDCVFAAWTSDFEIKVMHTMWISMGGTEEALAARNDSFRTATPEQMQEMQTRYKWKCGQHKHLNS